MKTFLDCIPCMMQQALRTARLSTDDEHTIKEVLDTAGGMIKNINMDETPAGMAEKVYREIRRITEVVDPYKKLKQAHIREALGLYPQLKKVVENSDNRLLTAIRLAIAGNVIDLGVNRKFNILEDVIKVLEQGFAICDINRFKEHLQKAKSILYLGDNTGESVFDRILIEELDKPVVFATRGIPVINDCTVEDAIASGLDKVATVISSGSPAPAIILHLCDPEFAEQFRQADMIISKGQGNFEGISNENGPVFFLLKVKCHVIANHLNVNTEDIILKYNEKI